MKISVLSLFRDSEKTLKGTLDRLDAVAAATDAEFSFFFYENDSVDNTKEILEDWGKATVISETLNAPRFTSVSTDDRFRLMGYYRNQLLKCNIESDYSLLLDSDVIFDKDLVNQYLNICRDEVPMWTPNTVVETIPCKMGGEGPVYYDSLALRDMDGNSGMTWASNPFYRSIDRSLWDRGYPVQVKSAFGGAAFIRTEVLKKVNWSIGPFCEHWGFCAQVNEFGPIFVVPSIKCNVVCSIDNIPQEHIDSVIEHQRNKYDFLNPKH